MSPGDPHTEDDESTESGRLVESPVPEYSWHRLRGVI